VVSFVEVAEEPKELVEHEVSVICAIGDTTIGTMGEAAKETTEMAGGTRTTTTTTTTATTTRLDSLWKMHAVNIF
jgi:hypothetical protein